MKTIGLIGGMSWESSASYYQLINQGVKDALGGLNSAKIVLVSVNFQEIEQLQAAGEWALAGQKLAQAAQQAQAGGADVALICTNTMHKVYEAVAEAVDIPLLHIADATAEVILNKGMTTIGLLGTRFTMEQDFYKRRLTDQYGIDVLVPDAAGRDTVHRVIYEELCLGEVSMASKSAYLRVIAELQQRGAEAVVLGCTEIGLLVNQVDTDVPLLDTTAIHAQAAVIKALE